MKQSATFVLAAGLLLTMSPIGQQAQDKPVKFSLGGGFTVPNSEIKDHLGNGYNFNFGVEVSVTPVIAIEGLYSFNGLGQKQISVPVSATPGATPVPTDFFGDMNMQYGTVEPRSAEAGRYSQAVRPRGHGRLLSADQSDDTRQWVSSRVTAIRSGTTAIREASFLSRTSSASGARPTSGWTSAAA